MDCVDCVDCVDCGTRTKRHLGLSDQRKSAGCSRQLLEPTHQLHISVASGHATQLPPPDLHPVCFLAFTPPISHITHLAAILTLAEISISYTLTSMRNLLLPLLTRLPSVCGGLWRGSNINSARLCLKEPSPPPVVNCVRQLELKG